MFYHFQLPIYRGFSLQEPMSGEVLLLCKICTDCVPKPGQGMVKARDISRNISIRSHGFTKPMPENRVCFRIWTQGFWKSVFETRVIWRHGFKKPVSKNPLPDSINGVTGSVPSIHRSDLLVVDAKMEAQETKLYNTLHH